MRRTILAGVVAALVALGVGGARADLSQDLGATFERVARELRDTFPKAETRVAAVAGGEVRLEGVGVVALRPGLELAAYRKGELYRHPVTNQPLGHAEEEIATLVVTAVTWDHATARIATTEGGRAPAVGDGARITAGRIPVAVLPPAGVAVGGETADQTALLLISRFSGLLEKTGRFLAVDPQRVLEAATPAGGATPPSPLEVARQLRAPAVLNSRVVLEDGGRYLETAWISGHTGATLITTRTPLVRATFPPRFAWEQTPERERRYALEGPARGLAMADLDGDGRPELIVGDDSAVRVYRWQVGSGLLTIAGGEFRPGGVILSVDAADVNGAGRAQVVVVDYRGGGSLVRSTVLELRGEGVRPLYETTGRFLRVVAVGREPWLLEQAVGDNEPFEGAIRRLVWREGRYRSGATLTVPKGVAVYGLALMRLTGSAEPEVVALTPEDQLAVWTARGRRLWTSAAAYGGAPISFAFTPARPSRDQDDVIGRILGRVVPLPDGPDGPELLVFENLVPVGGQARSLLPRLMPILFTQGRIHRLRWSDGGFVHVWESRVTEGYIADFAHGDLDGDGVPEVVVGVVPRGLNLDTLNPLGRPKAHLVFYELP